MTVYFVGSGPGDPELLTIKARRLLGSCRVCIYAGSLVSGDISALLPADAEKYDSARLSLDETTAICRDAHRRGLDIVRLHSGDPSIYGAIGEQMDELDKLGIPYEVVPGVSSFQASAAALRAELTMPEVSQTIILTRVADRTPVPESQELSRLAASRATLCIFLSVHKMREIAATLAPHYGSECPAAVVFHASRPDQTVVRGTLADIASKVESAGLKKTAIIVVGRAIERGPNRSKLYDADFSHGCREARGK